MLATKNRAVNAGAHGPAQIGALGQAGRLQLAFGALLTIGVAVGPRDRRLNLMR